MNRCLGMSQSKLLLLITLLAGIGLGAWARDAINSEPESIRLNGENTAGQVTVRDTSRPSIDSSSSDTLEELRFELQRAEQERSDLREQVEALSIRLSALDKQPVASAAPPTGTPSTRLGTTRRRGAGALTIDTLTEAGISERDANTIKSRLDELSMQRLYLRDQAQREGWLGKEEYRNEIRRLNLAQNNLEQEFGSDNYSRYLFAMGRPNQVNVQSVIDNSPAYNAGMQNGDRVVSYNGETVYDARTIRQGTQGGTAGEMVPVIVMRDGQRVELYVPRGPLGIQMTSESVRPPDSP